MFPGVDGETAPTWNPSQAPIVFSLGAPVAQRDGTFQPKRAPAPPKGEQDKGGAGDANETKLSPGAQRLHTAMTKRSSSGVEALFTPTEAQSYEQKVDMFHSPAYWDGRNDFHRAMVDKMGAWHDADIERQNGELAPAPKTPGRALDADGQDLHDSVKKVAGVVAATAEVIGPKEATKQLQFSLNRTGDGRGPRGNMAEDEELGPFFKGRKTPLLLSDGDFGPKTRDGLRQTLNVKGPDLLLKKFAETRSPFLGVGRAMTVAKRSDKDPLAVNAAFQAAIDRQLGRLPTGDGKTRTAAGPRSSSRSRPSSGPRPTDMGRAARDALASLGVAGNAGRVQSTTQRERADGPRGGGAPASNALASPGVRREAGRVPSITRSRDPDGPAGGGVSNPLAPRKDRSESPLDRIARPIRSGGAKKKRDDWPSLLR